MASERAFHRIPADALPRPVRRHSRQPHPRLRRPARTRSLRNPHLAGRPRRLLAALPVIALTGAALVGPVAPAAADSSPRGHDVSSHQKNVDWTEAREEGARFVYVKATESHSYRSPAFREQYNGAREAGLLRGAYHFAVPSASGGARQARFFLRNGGRWKSDGWTLPPALDIEHNPYNARQPCYGLSKSAMVRWIRSFSKEVRRTTGRRPVIYTTARWWNDCTGSSRSFRSHPLWLANWHDVPGPTPAGWSAPTFWQYADQGPLPGDQDRWNGTLGQLKKFARG